MKLTGHYTRLWTRITILLISMIFVSCRDTYESRGETYEVRGIFLARAFGGEAMVVHHESIPGYMEAMRMTLRLKDSSLATPIKPGDKIRFLLVVGDQGSYVEELTVLPADTPLEFDTTEAVVP